MNKLISCLMAVVCASIVLVAQPYRLMFTSGHSMEPTFKDGEVVIAQRYTGGAQVGDIVAFTTTLPDSGEPVVVGHRIIDIVDGKYVTMGDNNMWPDWERITDDDIILIVKGR